MWAATNSQIMHELLKTGKLLATTSSIADYLVYTAKFAELLKSHTLASVAMFNNEYCKLQSEYGFRWGSNSQHLHTRFPARCQPLVPGANATNLQKLPPHLDRQPQESTTTPTCHKFNSLTRCHWPNCHYHHFCLVPNCHQGHPLHEHHTITTA